MSRTPVRQLLGSLLLVMAGCGGDHPSSSSSAPRDAGPSGALSRQTFANAYGKARCDGYVRCSCVWSELRICAATGVCPTEQNCVSVMAADEEGALRSMSGLAVEFSVERAQACLDAIISADCGALRLVPGPCDPLFLPTLPLGASCTSMFECVGWETSQAVCEDGVCVAGGWEGPHLTAGSSCNSTAMLDPQSGAFTIYADSSATDPSQYLTCYAADGLACVAGVCAAPKPLGDSCSFDTDCVAGSVCLESACSAPLSLGATCSTNAMCAPGTYCANATTCAARAADGAACARNEECVSNHCFEQACLPYGAYPVCVL